MTRVSLTRGDLGRASPALCPLNLVSYSALTIASLPFSWRECRSRNIFPNDGSTNGLWAILLWSNDRVQKQPGPEIRRVATFRHQPLTNGGPRPGNISLLTGLVLTGLLEIVCSLQTAQSRHHCPVWRNSALLPRVQDFWWEQMPTFIETILMPDSQLVNPSGCKSLSLALIQSMIFVIYKRMLLEDIFVLINSSFD